VTDVAIRAEHLSKQYRLGERKARYRTLRSSLTEGVASRFGRGRGGQRRAVNADQTMWALDDVSFEIKRG
jgi:ABC-type polysaccharide/polyol phosphate transport system ATPase subunit